MIKILQNKLVWGAVVFISTLFVPWRVIYKGASVFMVLPLWWEYGNPQKNYLVILGHLTISIISGVAIALFIGLGVKKYKSHDNKNT